jgi:prepilin-type N-terminal cleavage/methylation domain-containing protein
MSPNSAHRRGFTLVEMLLVLAMIATLLGMVLPAIQRVRESAARSHSTNNLKTMGLAIHSIASCTDGVIPPSVGTFPAEQGEAASLFFNMLPFIECDPTYNQYVKNQDALETDVVTWRTYFAPLDPTNPGNHTTLTSYASNAGIFGLTDGGTARLPKDFADRGTANCVLFMERYGVVGPNGTRHTWPARGDRGNYLYPPSEDGPGPEDTAVPEFGVASRDASNNAPHAFRQRTLQVALADGSVRTITQTVTRTFNYGEDRSATIWAWACTLDGPLAKAKVPGGW